MQWHQLCLFVSILESILQDRHMPFLPSTNFHSGLPNFNHLKYISWTEIQQVSERWILVSDKQNVNCFYTLQTIWMAVSCSVKKIETKVADRNPNFFLNDKLLLWERW